MKSVALVLACAGAILSSPALAEFPGQPQADILPACLAASGAFPDLGASAPAWQTFLSAPAGAGDDAAADTAEAIAPLCSVDGGAPFDDSGLASEADAARIAGDAKTMCLRPVRTPTACLPTGAAQSAMIADVMVQPPPHAACTALDLSGNLTSVIRSCAALIDSGALQGKDLAEALRHQGDAYFRSNDVRAARENYVEALALWPDWPRALWNFGNASTALGEPEIGLRSYIRALEIDPGFARAHTAIGILHIHRGNVDGALQEFTRAIEADPDEYHARLSRAMLHHEAGRPLDALRDLDTLLREDEADLNETYVHWGSDFPTFVSAVRHKRARALDALGAADEAIAELEALLARDPTFVWAALDYSRLTVRHWDDFARAERAIDVALQASPNHWRLFMEKARLLARTDRGEAARAMLLDSARFDKTAGGRFFMTRAMVWRLLNQYRAAEADILAGMERDGRVFAEMVSLMQELGYLMDLPGVDPGEAFANALTACSYDFVCQTL